MINLILTLSLSAVNPTNATTAQFRPCVWPNVCTTVEAPAAVAQFRPCVWPNVCKTEAAAPVLVIAPAVEVAQFTTCVYPRKCGKHA
jgi:hypothetical protein